MPIRLNLLAEAQAAEDMRRRDPVKRCAWIAALLVALMLGWSSSLQLKSMIVSREIASAENQMRSFTNDYQSVVTNQKKLDEVRHKINSLVRLSTNRFLQANALNALQKATIEEVQLIHFKSEQSYSVTEASKPRTNEVGRVTPGKPATSTERILLSLEGSDSSPNPGDQVPGFKKVVAGNPYFKEAFGRPAAVNLTRLSPPENALNGRRSVYFTLECRFPEVTR
jgi:hypothetical protein